MRKTKKEEKPICFVFDGLEYPISDELNIDSGPLLLPVAVALNAILEMACRALRRDGTKDLLAAVTPSHTMSVKILRPLPHLPLHMQTPRTQPQHALHRPAHDLHQLVLPNPGRHRRTSYVHAEYPAASVDPDHLVGLLPGAPEEPVLIPDRTSTRLPLREAHEAELRAAPTGDVVAPQVEVDKVSALRAALPAFRLGDGEDVCVLRADVDLAGLRTIVCFRLAFAASFGSATLAVIN